MATVTLLQPSEFESPPAAAPLVTTYQTGKYGEIEISGTAQNYHYYGLGVISAGSDRRPVGTLTRVLIDDTDAGSFPNIDISDLNFQLGDGYFRDLLRHRLALFLSDLLSGNDSVSGSAFDDQIQGFKGNDTLFGNGGDDLIAGDLGRDTLFGGAGDDTYFIGEGFAQTRTYDAIVEKPEAGDDAVSLYTDDNPDGLRGRYVLPANVERGQIYGTSSFDMSGNRLDNLLFGNDRDNTLNGAAGDDTMAGGAGADSYFVDTALDRVAEKPGEGNDRVYASVGYQLSFGAEVEILTTNNSLATAAINLTGNEFDNAIIGNFGANVLNGRDGYDRLEGLKGNDTYHLLDIAVPGPLGVLSYDAVVEAPGGGTDQVLIGPRDLLGADVYTLGANIENGTIGGSQSFDLTGNALANILTGNGAGNTFNGLGGIDTMIGGPGDDFYFADRAQDVVREVAGGGNDRIYAIVSYILAQGTDVEFLSTNDGYATVAINLTGNELANHVGGNFGNNVLNGGGGNDYLEAINGNDTLNGGEGRDTLQGGAGDDVMNAGVGADQFLFDDAGFGRDRINAFEDGVDRLHFTPLVADNINDFTIVGNGSNIVTLTYIVNPANAIVLQSSTPIAITASDFVFG